MKKNTMKKRSRILGVAILCCVATAAAISLADMMQDSPVKFPDKGALPSKYPPDVKTKHESPEPDYSIFETPQRSLEQIAKQILSKILLAFFEPSGASGNP